MRTIIGVCLDESGSMGESGKREAAISAFNEYLREQQRNAVDECLMAVAKFNTTARIAQKMEPVASVAALTPQTYIPGGGTALFDAIAYTVKEVERGIADDDRVVCVILTDGEENSSRETTLAQVKELIAAKEASKAWTFVYLSSSPDAFAHGRSFGLAAGNIGQYANTGAGVHHAVAAMSANTVGYRRSAQRASASMAAGVSSRPQSPMPPLPKPNTPAPVAVADAPDADMWGDKA